MTRSAKPGRPDTPLSKRPYRYALALSEALASIPISRRAAIHLAQAAYNGVLPTEAADGSLMLAAAAQDYVNPLDAARTDAEIAAERDPFKLVDEDLDRHRERCRSIARWHAKDPDELAWLKAMGEAIRIAAGPWRPGASEAVLDLATSANETEWARRVLLPMLLRKAALAA